jgi:hypothetical protein
MIVVQDRIEIAGDRLGQLQQLFQDNYIEAAARRGLHLVESLVSPPVLMQQAPCTLWLRWQVADPAAWWAMRAQSGDPAVGHFWQNVDALCIARERSYLAADAAADLPQAEDISAMAIQTRGYRETAQLALRDGLTDADRAALETALRRAATELEGVEAVNLGANFAPEYAAGHYSWDVLYSDRDAAAAAQRSPFWQSTVQGALKKYTVTCHALGLETLGAGLRRRNLANGIKRTAFFRMLPGAAAGVAQRFEKDLLEMPAQIPQILNWRLSRAITLPWHSAPCAPWTYVWEQEFESIDGLLGPYMAHPHHWAHIDRWFDPESGRQAVDVNLSHAFCALPASILGHESQ